MDLAAPPDPESIRDAKGWLSNRMASVYRENADQQNFAAVFDWRLAATRAPSLDKLVRDLTRLAEPYRS